MLEHLSQLEKQSITTALFDAVPQALVQQALEIKKNIESQGQESTEKTSGKFSEPPVAAYGDVSAFHQVSLLSVRQV